MLPASQRVGETQWYEGTADAVFQNMDIIEDYGPRYIVLLAGDHIYKMDYEIMLRQHVDTGADVTIGCLEVPRMEATGFGVMHVDGRDRVDRFRREAQGPAGHSRQAGHGARLDGHLRVRDAVPDGAAAPRRRDRRLEPRLRQGHHPLYRQERHGLGAPLPALLRALVARKRSPTGATSARSMPTGRPTSTSADVNPQLDLYDRDWPIWTYAEITPPAKFVHDFDGRRGSAVNSLVSGDCIISGGSLTKTLLSTGSRVHSYSELARSGGPAVLRRSAAARGSSGWSSIAASTSPRAWWSARIPSSTRKWFRRTDEGVTLITQPMIDKYLASR